MALKGQRNFIKLALVNLHGMVTGVLGEDSFIGLELQAQKQIKIKEGQKQHQNAVISLD